MGIENLFAAKVFSALYPWIDKTDANLSFMLDQGGTDPSSKPDLVFRFEKGSPNKPVRIEFKLAIRKRSTIIIKLTKNQVKTWCNANHKDIPDYWIAISKTQSVFYFWEHAAIRHELLRKQLNRSQYIQFSLRVDNCNVFELKSEIGLLLKLLEACRNDGAIQT